MTTVNWIGIGLMAALIIAGVMLTRHFRKKVKDLDGFGGIMKGDGQKAYREEDKPMN